MTNREKYKRTFSALHASNNIMEVKAMEKTKRLYMPKIFAVCAVIVLILGLASVAYAADVGGIQRNVQIWINGDQTNAILEIQQSEDEYTSYTLSYEDSDGEIYEQHGGGVAMNADGTERAITEEEILEQLNMPDVEYEDDGSVWVYYHGQSIDITDKFDDSGACYVQLKDGDNILYLTVKYNDGFSVSDHSFPNPHFFN